MAKNAIVQESQPEPLKTEPLARQDAEVESAAHPQAVGGAAVNAPYVRPELPDFIGRMRAIFGDKVLEVTGAELIREDRDRY